MKVVVGLSGGVDSSVTAYLLKEQGYEVIGLFMRNWNDSTVTLEDECPWIEDSNDALLVAKKLGIPFQVIDLSDVYKEKIVDYMFAEYEKGRTPNPDILCNREIKFDVFLEMALKLGAEKVATGHYARVRKNVDGSFSLLAGKDKNKDQSYFLCQLNQKQLSQSLFPIGELTKPEVREIAKKQNLITAEKKDSQGLCFIGKVSLPDFLQQQLKAKKGKIIEIFSDCFKLHQQIPKFQTKEEELEYFSKDFHFSEEDGKTIGEHDGAHFFTIGQRKGLGVGGHVEPVFVLENDVIKNIIYVGESSRHKGLFKKVLFIKNEDLHYVNTNFVLKTSETLVVKCRFRYRQELKDAMLHKVDTGLYIEFEELQSAITKGQFAAWYLDEELLGSGVIN